jgi:LmbE family N-acetylglucosaminyl deacetylase
MRSEQELVPYSPGTLEGDPVLVLAPHPDDELFGCGAFLARAADEGRRVEVLVLTDGGAQGDPETRRAESREAARRLGTPEPRFAGLRDRGLEPDLPGLVGALHEAVDRIGPGILLTPSPAEVHPDHRAVALAVAALAASGAVPADTVVAAYEVSAMLRPNLLLDAGPVWERVLHAARAFGSQLGSHPYLEVLECAATIRALTLGPTVSRAEGYHVLTAGQLRAIGPRAWAARQGPTEGLELPEPRAGLLRRLFGGHRGRTVRTSVRRR